MGEGRSGTFDPSWLSEDFVMTSLFGHNIVRSDKCFYDNNCGSERWRLRLSATHNGQILAENNTIV